MNLESYDMSLRLTEDYIKKEALRFLMDLEFTEVYNMLDGMTSWKNAEYPVTTDVPVEQDLTIGINEVNIQSLSLSPNPVAGNLHLGVN